MGTYTNNVSLVSNLKWYIFFGTVVILIIGTVIWIGVSGLQKPAASNTTANTSNAPATSTTKSPTPMATLIKAPNRPVFTGFEILRDHGLSTNQLDDVTFSITKFNKTLATPGQNITLLGNSLVFSAQQPDAASRSAGFTIQLDSRTSYTVNVRYFDLTAAQTIIADPATKKVVFDSGTVDLYEGIGN